MGFKNFFSREKEEPIELTQERAEDILRRNKGGEVVDMAELKDVIDKIEKGVLKENHVTAFSAGVEGSYDLTGRGDVDETGLEKILKELKHVEGGSDDVKVAA